MASRLAHYSLAILLLVGAAIGTAQADVVFYLHGKIVEDHGDGAEHPVHGAYAYLDVVESIRSMGHSVHSEVRAKNTDAKAYADRVARQITALKKGGTASEDIVVIGFSKGAQIAILVSQQLQDSGVRFVLQAVCGSWIKRRPEITISGVFLSM